MSFGSIIFTDKGRILQAKAQAGKQLNFTKIQIGDGQLGGAAIQSLNALISPKKNISITNIKTSTSTATVGGILNNSDIATGFYWREVGLFAADPDTGVETLYCYGNAGNLAEYIPAGGGSSILEKRLDIVATIGNATNISAAIDSSLIYLTLSDLDAHNNSGTAHPDIREQISGLSGEVVDLKSSVSSGKQVVATAITGKGVPTSGDATFSQMANNIGQIQTQSILTGDAVAANVILGKTFYSNNPNSKLSGTMANNGAVNASLANNAQQYTIPAGYHNGAGKVTASIANLLAANIKTGATVGGVAGTFSGDATAGASDISLGKTAYVNGTKLTGTTAPIDQIKTAYNILLATDRNSMHTTYSALGRTQLQNITSAMVISGDVYAIVEVDTFVIASTTAWTSIAGHSQWPNSRLYFLYPGQTLTIKPEYNGMSAYVCTRSALFAKFT